ncbi:EAL domain-containing protein [Bacillus badius]|uniref:Phosphodiesterase n=1 Tax=Bacillus badius TaxID=1455 RepID=A0ABR5AW91_BACBA|nr:EAL domain-containing protein [Bacillus badius]KIL79003.1 phosphodiesterase [Bacillus badius]KZR58817.1 hypothetical protein A3781_14830 [Bacillus badius]MED4715559.1 EAL domain-containing protein [Bacillus badius]
MEQRRITDKFWKVDGWGILIPLLFLVLALCFRESLFAIFDERNYVILHLIFEIFIIGSSFAIAVQAWMISPYILSNQRLWLGALFFSVGWLEMFHAITYKGMPFFLMESTPYNATWFYMISRLTQAFGLLMILLIPDRQVNTSYRWISYSLALVYAVSWIALIFYPVQLLPELVIEGSGPTSIKVGLQYTAILLQCFCFLFLVKNFNKAKTRNFMMIIASVYLIIGDSMFTSYKSVYDITNFIGHLFQLTGFYCLLKALYYTSVEEPFQRVRKAERRLRESEESLHYMAYHDERTKLPNVRYFKEKLGQTLTNEPDSQKAVLVVEIDRFDAIYESLGHTFSDLTLQSVAERLYSLVSSNVFIGKKRGKEFTIFLTSVDHKEEVLNLCEKVQELMKEPIQVQHLQLNMTVNIGIALYPEHGTNEDELLKHAQMAAYEAQKETQRLKFYQEAMDKQFIDRLMLEHDLHKALAKGELHIDYQPQVNVRTGDIVSFEALIRWKHPERGWISPSQFIPIAEETGLIAPIGEWVLKTACQQLKEWHNQGISHIGVAVNLSTRQFFQQNLVDIIKDSLKEADLAPHFLELEITESMTTDMSYAASMLADLKKLGIRIAVDDFGTGYSSLHYLKDLPIDCLKIDRSFVQHVPSDKHNAALISTILAIAEHLCLSVIAEGVEEMEQLSFLWENNCYQVQGYLFSPPLPPEKISCLFAEIQGQASSYCQQLKLTDVK